VVMVVWVADVGVSNPSTPCGDLSALAFVASLRKSDVLTGVDFVVFEELVLEESILLHQI
jgi:hypothetical protein